MKPLTTENKFFLFFLSTIILTRVALFIAGLYVTNWDALAFTFFGFRSHHYMYGLVLIPIGLAITNIGVYAIGLGLFVDELTYLLIGGQSHADNYSLLSLTGTAILVLIVFLLRKKVLVFFLRITTKYIFEEKVAGGKV